MKSFADKLGSIWPQVSAHLLITQVIIAKISHFCILISHSIHHDVLRVCDCTVRIAEGQSPLSKTLPSIVMSLRVENPVATGTCSQEFLPELCCKIQALSRISSSSLLLHY